MRTWGQHAKQTVTQAQDCVEDPAAGMQQRYLLWHSATHRYHVLIKQRSQNRHHVQNMKYSVARLNKAKVWFDK